MANSIQAQADRQAFREVAPQLVKNGYAPLPLFHGLKKPAIEVGWTSYVYKPADAKEYARNGTGILTAYTPAADIDVYNEQLATEFDALAEQMLGPAPRRVGQPPKCLRLYRLEGAPFGKIQTHAYRFADDAPTQKASKVEFLANGQQCVAFNVHPDTHKPYIWNGSGSPLTVPVGALTAVTEAQARAYISECNRILAQHAAPATGMHVEDDNRARATSHEGIVATNPADCRAALEFIPNDVCYDDWIRMGHAIKGALGEEGYDAFDKWSAKSPLYNKDVDTAAAWRSFKAARIGAGTIYFFAAKHGWGRTRALEAKTALQTQVEQVNAEHALIQVQGKVCVMWKDRERWGGLNFPLVSTVGDIKLLWSNRQTGKINPVNEWLVSEQRSEYHGIVFKPGADSGSYFNLFHGWGVEPVKGDCSLFLEHLRVVVCNRDESLFQYFLQWLANIVQCPQAKPGTAIAMGGLEGSGKGAIARYMRRILGDYLVQLSGGDQLLGRFNDVFAGKLLIYGDEVVWPGDKKGINKLKAYITEERISVERKHVPAFEIDNFTRLMTSTNLEHNAPAEINDRRWVPLPVSPDKVGNRAYWEALEAERLGQGPAALLYHLLEVKITCDLRTNPKTVAHTEQKLLGLDDVGQFWRESLMNAEHLLEEGYGEKKNTVGFWQFNEPVPTTTLHEFYLDFAKRNRIHYPVSIDALGRGLRRYVPDLSKRKARVDEQRGLRVGSNTMVYILPPLAEAREAFAEVVGGAVDWPTDGEAAPF
jgi:Primase C terminal 2 (PriCT-2)/Family of unknown function (DUF5906)